ncbi:50S ribosomal protein L4, partial [Candidatus Kuenenbacteria bacterium RBG_16_41_7]
NTRNFSQKINKKMKKAALFSCLSDKAKQKTLMLLDKLELTETKTKEFAKIILNLKNILNLKEKKTGTVDSKKTKPAEKKNLKDYSLSLLVVASENVSRLSKTGRNIPGVKIIGANSLNVVDLLHYKNLLMLEDSLPVIEKTYLTNK